MKILFLFLLFYSVLSFSHPGKRNKIDDCHYCKSNCEKLNLTKDTRHSHSNKTCDPSLGPVDTKQVNITAQVEVIKPQGKYHRKKFKHWTDEDKDCKNTRAEILEQRSLSKVTYRTRKNGKECVVLTGKWEDYYFPETLQNASDIDIDHVVPLKEAWLSGASFWKAKKRESFANDPENLVITSKHTNRKKGANTPLTWAPSVREYYCKYLKQWIYIKNKYDLTTHSKIFEYYKGAKCEK